jgi:hypothetical protein
LQQLFTQDIQKDALETPRKIKTPKSTKKLPVNEDRPPNDLYIIPTNPNRNIRKPPFQIITPKMNSRNEEPLNASIPINPSLPSIYDQEFYQKYGVIVRTSAADSPHSDYKKLIQSSR